MTEVVMSSSSMAGGDFGQQKRENLLDVVTTSMQKQGKTNIFSRVIVVAKFSKRETGVDSVKAMYQKSVERNDPSGEVSGMLIAWPSCMCCMLEGRTSTLMSILREVLSVSSSRNPSELKLAETRVVSSTEDIPSRCYSGFHCAFIANSSMNDMVDPCDASSIVKVASELNAFLRKAGGSLQGLSDSDMKRRMASLDSYVEGIPAPEVILSLTPAEDAPTIEEYLDIFDAPVNVDLDSESVWPMPVPLKY